MLLLKSRTQVYEMVLLTCKRFNISAVTHNDLNPLKKPFLGCNGFASDNLF